MDIAGMSTALSQFQVKQQASVSVMKKALETAEGKADGLTNMMDAAKIQQEALPHLGGSIDLKL